MKRFLLLFCTAVLCCALIAVPALAAETGTYSLDISDSGSCMDGDPISLGHYRVELYLSGSDQPILITADFEFTNLQVCVSLPSFTYEGVSYSVQCCPDTGGLSTADIYADSGDFDLGSCTLKFSPVSGSDVPVKGKQPSLTDSGSIMDVFGVVGTWIIGMLTSMTGIFWTGSQLTMVGVLAVCGLAFAVIFLIVALISRFLHFRG